MPFPSRFEWSAAVEFGSKFSVERAHAMQLRLSKKVIKKDLFPKPIRCVAGVDVAYSREVSIGAAAVFDYDSLSLLEFKTARVETSFPYIPTLLSFREIPPTLVAITKLQKKPDVLLVDGQGTAHPYRLGFASHLGLVLDMSTIGVAKSRLCGEVEPLRGKRWTPIADRGEVIGAAVVTRHGEKPLYVSVGHKVSLKTAVDIVLHCTRAGRIPQPIQAAHALASEEKRKQDIGRKTTSGVIYRGELV